MASSTFVGLATVNLGLRVAGCQQCAARGTAQDRDRRESAGDDRIATDAALPIPRFRLAPRREAG